MYWNHLSLLCPVIIKAFALRQINRKKAEHNKERDFSEMSNKQKTVLKAASI